MSTTARITLASPPTDDYSRVHEITRLVITQGQEMLIEALGQWQMFRYQTAPKPRLELYVNTQGVPAAVITKNANHTLSIRAPHYLKKGQSIQDYRYHFHAAMTEQATTILFDWLHTKTKSKDLDRVLLKFSTYRRIGNSFKDTVSLAVRAALSQYSIDDIPSNSGFQTAGVKLNAIIRKTFLNPEVQYLANGYRDPKTNHADHYNLVARNLKTFRIMHRDSPKVLNTWCWLFEQTTPDEIKTPGRAAHQVKNALNVTEAQWKIFANTGTDILQHNDTSLEPARLSLQALTQANCPKAPKPVARTILREHAAHDFFSAANWLRGDPWQAWIHLIAAMLRHSVEYPERYLHDYLATPSGLSDFINSGWNSTFNSEHTQGYIAFRKARDTLMHHVRGNLPWPLTTLENYYRRSDQWHEARKSEVVLHQEALLAAQRWQSALETTELDHGITAVPVTNRLGLHRLAKEMNNCISSFATPAANGSWRIFKLINEEGKLLSAISLSKIVTGTSKYWTISDHEAPNHKRPPDAALMAATKLPYLYQQADSTS